MDGTLGYLAAPTRQGESNSKAYRRGVIRCWLIEGVIGKRVLQSGSREEKRRQLRLSCGNTGTLRSANDRSIRQILSVLGIPMPDHMRRTMSTRVWPFLLEVFQLILLA